MRIAELDAHDATAWDDYVYNSVGSMPHHLAGWRSVLSKTYGYQTSYLLAKERGCVRGVLPLYIIRSFLVGRSAVTMQGGLLADDERVAAALIEAGQMVAKRAGARQVVLHDTRQIWPGELLTNCHHVHWVVPVTAGEEALWKKVKNDIRRNVRQGRKIGLEVQIDRSGTLVDEFYHLMSRFTHQVGTPVFGRRFLENVVREFPDKAIVSVVRHGPVAVAAYFSLAHRDAVHVVWGANLREYRHLRASYLAYWEMLLDAARHGHACLDMGRSPVDSGPSQFKSQFRGYSNPVCQQIAAVDGARTGESISGRVHTDARFQQFSRVWARLPFPVHQALGPHLRRHVPFA